MMLNTGSVLWCHKGENSHLEYVFLSIFISRWNIVFISVWKTENCSNMLTLRDAINKLQPACYQEAIGHQNIHYYYYYFNKMLVITVSNTNKIFLIWDADRIICPQKGPTSVVNMEMLTTPCFNTAGVKLSSPLYNVQKHRTTCDSDRGQSHFGNVYSLHDRSLQTWTLHMQMFVYTCAPLQNRKSHSFSQLIKHKLIITDLFVFNDVWQWLLCKILVTWSKLCTIRFLMFHSQNSLFLPIQRFSSNFLWKMSYADLIFSCLNIWDKQAANLYLISQSSYRSHLLSFWNTGIQWDFHLSSLTPNHEVSSHATFRVHTHTPYNKMDHMYSEHTNQASERLEI